jgi:hypothetical protein
MAEPTVQELQQQLTDLNKKLKEAGGLGIDFDEAIKRAGGDVKVLQTYIAQLNKQYEDLVDNADYIYQTFRDISAELKNQNVLLKIGKSSFKGFTDIAQDLNSYQKGYNDLTDSKFKKLQNNLALEKKELEFVVARLKASEKSRIAEIDRLSNALKKDELEGKQKTFAENRLKELQKENILLINAKEALNSGIPILENELNLTKQIANTRKDLGGLSQAAGKLISQYGGSLASFLNVSEATEAIEEFNKKLIQEALSTEKVKNDLLENERKKRLAEIGKDEAGNSITQEQAQERLITLEKEAYDIKKAAIASTDTLANKSQSLGILIKGLGEGFKKSLNDPFVQFTIGLKLVKSGFNDIKKAFNIFLEFDKVFTNTARGLGMSTDQVTKMANAAKFSGDQFGKNAYTAEQITKAIGESNAQLGLSVDLGANTTSEFAAMTNQMGLSAEEATNIYKLGLLNNMSLEDTNKTIASSIIATQKQTGVQVNARQVLQEIGKLSAGITSKFQQNPAALAQAVTQAKALGTTLEQVDKVGESLLNFESSIENELKAELLTGKQINLEKARYAALTGDQATLTQELANQVGSLADFQGMNVIAQKSLAEAFGLSRDEVADMLTKQETFNKLGDVSKKSAQEQLEIARERGLSEEDSLVKNLQQQAAAEKLEATFDKLKSTLAGIVQGPLGTLVTFMAELLKNSFAVYGILGIALAGSIVKLVLGFGQLIKVARIFKKLEIGSAIAAAAKAAFSSPLGQVTGGLAAIGLLAASVGAIMAAVNTATNADDFKSVGDDSSGHGNRMLLTPEGTFKINNKDTIIGGTDKSFNTPSPSISGTDKSLTTPFPSIGINKSTTPMANYGITKEDMRETFNDLLNGILNRPQATPQFALHVDGRQIGTAIGKQMETGTAQNIYTGYKVA